MRRATWLLAGAMLVFVAACHRQESSGAGGGEGAPGDSASRGPAAFVAYPTADYVEQAPGVPGGTLRVSVAQDTGTLDLHSISSTNCQWLGRLIYDNLVYLDDKGEITPWLAKSWTVSPDGKTYTFHLRDDVTFSDGTKFNAEAVRVNLEHMRDPATKSPLAAAYIVPYVDGRAVDEYTFEATLREPYSAFLNVLAQSWLAIYSAKAIQEKPKQLGEAPVGSGPFVVESYTRQQGIRLVKRKDYHWAPAFLKHDGPAYLDRIEIDFVPEAMVRYSSLAAGQYDFTIDAPAQNAAAIRADPSLIFDRRIRQGNPSRGLTFNTSQAPFDDVAVRRAVAAAIDREGITQIVGFGEFQPKSDFLAANTKYYDPSTSGILRYDVAEANRLLDAAGWTGRDAEGFRTKAGKRLAAEALVTESGTPSPVYVAIQSDLKKVGFDLTLVQLPAAQIMDRRKGNQYQALSGGVWHTNTPDGLYILYHGAEITSDRRIGQNSSRLQDPELDDLLTRARHASDPAVLQDLYSKAQRRLVEVVPAVPLYENYTLTAWRKRVQGVLFDTSHNTPIWTAAWLKESGS